MVIVDSGAPALGSTPVATNAILMAEAVGGCVMRVVVIVAVGTPTVTGAVNGHPEPGGCSIRWEGNFRNSKSYDDDLSTQ